MPYCSLPSTLKIVKSENIAKMQFHCIYLTVRTTQPSGFSPSGPFVADSGRPSCPVVPNETLSRETSIKQLKAETTKATIRWPMRWCSKYGEKALSIAMALESIPQLKLLSWELCSLKQWSCLARPTTLARVARQAAQTRNWHFERLELEFFQYFLCYFMRCFSPQNLLRSHSQLGLSPKEAYLETTAPLSWSVPLNELFNDYVHI